MQTLRSKLIRLAYRNPDLRSDLLPLLKSSSIGKTSAWVSIPDRIDYINARRIELDQELDNLWFNSPVYPAWKEYHDMKAKEREEFVKYLELHGRTLDEESCTADEWGKLCGLNSFSPSGGNLVRALSSNEETFMKLYLEGSHKSLYDENRRESQALLDQRGILTKEMKWATEDLHTPYWAFVNEDVKLKDKDTGKVGSISKGDLVFVFWIGSTKFGWSAGVKKTKSRSDKLVGWVPYYKGVLIPAIEL